MNTSVNTVIVTKSNESALSFELHHSSGMMKLNLTQIQFAKNQVAKRRGQYQRCIQNDNAVILFKDKLMSLNEITAL